MDTVQVCLAKVQRQGMDWENVRHVVEYMHETVTLHDVRVMTKKDLYVACSPASVRAMVYLATNLLDKDETCEITGVAYTASSLIVWLINTDQSPFNALMCTHLIKIIDTYHTPQFSAVIRGTSHSLKDLVLHGLSQSFIPPMLAPFLMMRLAMLMDTSETIHINRRSFTRTDLLLHVINDKNSPHGSLGGFNKAMQLILESLPEGAKLKKSDTNKKYIIVHDNILSPS